MRADIDRWNQKYEDAATADSTPDPVLLSHRNLLDGRGRALDVACGLGQNAVFLAQLGYEVVGVDGSLVALRRCRARLRDQTLNPALIVADLERFTLPREYFDLVVVIRYLQRSLIPQLRSTLKPGGLLIYKTFNIHWLQYRTGFNRAFLLEPGELAALFADLDTIETNDSPRLTDPESYWIGRKPV